MTNLCTWSVLFSFIDTILTSKALNNKCKRKTTDLNWHDLAYHKQLVQSYIRIFIHLKLYMWLRVILIEFTRDYLSASQNLNKTKFHLRFFMWSVLLVILVFVVVFSFCLSSLCVLCTMLDMCLWIILSWLPIRFSLTFMYMYFN